MCGVSFPFLILIILIEVFVIGAFIVKAVQKSSMSKLAEEKELRQIRDGRFVPQTYEEYLRSIGEEIPDFESEGKQLIQMSIVTLIIAALIYYFFIY
jgi:hypothetical protein